ncbi:BatD family protein [Stieleria sp. TO1_6]|uniref:BatD family protein n=1 Tax=Stieleria tagensis TaxID=2956795 RepID=UPI00209B6D50|nr:BatD family protein [Stieleria tagensis]MCO8120773.1 BatD family protein [Stieleria tagensis]
MSLAWTPLNRLRIQCCLLGVLICSCAVAQDTSTSKADTSKADQVGPKVRASLQSKDTIWVGQKLALVVEVLVPGYFDSAASFDLPDPQGVLLMPPAEHPSVSSEKIDDVDYTVQRHELWVYPMRDGKQAVPALTVRFSYKPMPMDKQAINAALKTTPLPFTVKRPPGTDQLGQILSGEDVKVDETWKPQPGTDDVKTGSAFTRTITFTAPDIPGMLFPPFSPDDIDGVGIYVKHQLRDQTARGSMKGERQDVITYVCEKPGQYKIPAERFSWYDIKAKQLQTIDLPAQTLNVIANPALASGAADPDGATTVDNTDRLVRWWKPLLAIGLILLVILGSRNKRLRSLVSDWFAPFRPQHLQPMNPTQSSD